MTTLTLDLTRLGRRNWTCQPCPPPWDASAPCDSVTFHNTSQQNCCRVEFHRIETFGVNGIIVAPSKSCTLMFQKPQIKSWFKLHDITPKAMGNGTVPHTPTIPPGN